MDKPTGAEIAFVSRHSKYQFYNHQLEVVPRPSQRRNQRLLKCRILLIYDKFHEHHLRPMLVCQHGLMLHI